VTNSRIQRIRVQTKR